MKIMGIHGIGNYRGGELPEESAANLSRIWSTHLAAGAFRPPSALEVKVVYYADLLRVPGGQGADDDVEDLTDEETAILLEILEPLPTPPGTAQGRLTSLARAKIAEVAASWACPPWALEWLMVRMAKEATAYLAPGEPRVQAQDRLIAAVEDFQPDVLLAHSLGTVVAYEALHQRDDVPIPLWVTLGSPLALSKAIFQRLLPQPVQDKGRRPPGVRQWANLADRGDLFAIPPMGISRSFSGVASDEECSIHAFDFHLVKNYLKTHQLTRILKTAC